MIFIAGASGFVGGHLIDALLKSGYKLRCLARSEKAKKLLFALANPPERGKEKGIEVVSGDITEPATLAGALNGIDFVIHLVGIMQEKGAVTFERVHVEGTKNLVSEARKSGAKHFFYQSALGADKSSWSGYLRTKAEAEEIVRSCNIPFSIFRPSLIIGPWDGFTKKLSDIIKMSPVIPIPGDGKSKFQPVYINDWVKCMLKVIASPESFRGTFEIGGPGQLTYNEIVRTLAEAMKVKKPVVHMPMGLMKFGALLTEKTFLPFLPVTSDQLRLLEAGNICDVTSVEKSFGFKPMKYADALKGFIK